MKVLCVQNYFYNSMKKMNYLQVSVEGLNDLKGIEKNLSEAPGRLDDGIYMT